MGNFKELKVWLKAKDLAISIYRTSSKGKVANDFGLRDQIRRSAISIVSNIAEGDETGGDKLSIRYFNIAKGSSAELYTQLLIIRELEYIEAELLDRLLMECETISRMLHSLIKARTRSLTLSPTP